MSNEEVIEKMRYIMAHPVRYRIVKLLKEAGDEGLYVNKIAKILGIDRKLVSYHMLVLLRNDIVVGRYGVRGGPPTDEKGRPVVVAYHKLTQRAKEALKGLPI